MNFKGSVIDERRNNELYTLTAGMMYGIRYCVASILNKPYTKLTVDDFSYEEELEFPPEGSSRTPSHQLKHTFYFKSYAPKVFHKLRSFYDIDAESYMSSVCGKFNYIEFISNSKSGQFFFYSHDGKYMLKTQTQAENRFMKQILLQYSNHLQSNPYSFLCRILGMHRLTMPHLNRKVHFVVMASVFDTPVPMTLTYDLKGSLHGREATPQEKANGGMLKDLDLKNSGKKLQLGRKKKPFMEQLEKDVKFLTSLNIMDYSLLVGIHSRSSRQTRIDPNTIPTQSKHDLFENNQFAGFVRKNLPHKKPSNLTTSTPQKGQGEVHPSDNETDYDNNDYEETGDEDEDYYVGCDFGDSDDDGNFIPRTSLPTYRSQPKEISTYFGNGITVSRPFSSRFDLGINSVDPLTNKRGDEIYYVGIIDILQLYNISKAGETLVKSVANDRKTISSVPSKYYGKRFLKFLDNNIE